MLFPAGMCSLISSDPSGAQLCCTKRLPWLSPSALGWFVRLQPGAVLGAGVSSARPHFYWAPSGPGSASTLTSVPFGCGLQPQFALLGSAQ